MSLESRTGPIASGASLVPPRRRSHGPDLDAKVPSAELGACRVIWRLDCDQRSRSALEFSGNG